QVWSDVMPLALKLMAFGALVLEYGPAPLERPPALKKGGPHPSNERVELGRRVLADLTPDRLDLAVQPLITESAQTKDGIVVQIGPRNLILAHGGEQLLAPLLASGQEVDGLHPDRRR